MTNESPENTLYSYIEISSREISTANEKKHNNNTTSNLTLSQS